MTSNQMERFQIRKMVKRVKRLGIRKPIQGPTRKENTSNAVLESGSPLEIYPTNKD